MELRLACTSKGEAEIFESVQGEGRNIGRRRTFVRLSGCNLHCVWCDTAYTWNWQGTPFAHEADRPGKPYKFDPAAEMIKLDVADVAARVLASNAEGVVITGGEPLMQQTAVAALADAIKAGAPSRLVEIETNGTIIPNADLARLVDLFMVSPKLAHSGNDAEIALKASSLQAFVALPAAAFKFVVKDTNDLDAVASLAKEYAIANERIYVMPEGVTSTALIERGRSVIEGAIARGYNFTDRLHIHLWGAKRGV